MNVACMHILTKISLVLVGYARKSAFDDANGGWIDGTRVMELSQQGNSGRLSVQHS